MTATTTQPAHYLLADLAAPATGIVLACYAMDSLITLSRHHGQPITLEQATLWLSGVENELGPDWLEWRIGGMFNY